MSMMGPQCSSGQNTLHSSSSSLTSSGLGCVLEFAVMFAGFGGGFPFIFVRIQAARGDKWGVNESSRQARFALYGVVDSLFLLSRSRTAFRKCHQQSWISTDSHMSRSMPISAISLSVCPKIGMMPYPQDGCPVTKGLLPLSNLESLGCRQVCIICLYISYYWLRHQVRALHVASIPISTTSSSSNSSNNIFANCMWSRFHSTSLISIQVTLGDLGRADGLRSVGQAWCWNTSPLCYCPSWWWSETYFLSYFVKSEFLEDDEDWAPRERLCIAATTEDSDRSDERKEANATPFDESWNWNTCDKSCANTGQYEWGKKGDKMGLMRWDRWV